MIDLKNNPKLAIDEQIFAVPTLVRKSPEPVIKIIGDLSHTEKVINSLDITPELNSNITLDLDFCEFITIILVFALIIVYDVDGISDSFYTNRLH